MDSDGLNKKNVYGNRQRGAEVRIDQNGKAEIELLGNASASSLYYATAHVFLSSLLEVAEGGGNPSMAMRQQIKKDLQTLREFAEEQRHRLPVRTGGREWQPVPLTGTLTTEQLETLYEVTAIAYIKYLKEAEAPSRELENTFSSIKDFLKDESDSLPDITLNSELIQVFDHMLATDTEIQSKKGVRLPTNRPTHTSSFPQSSVPRNIPTKILSRANTVTKRVGLLCLGFGIVFLLLGLVAWNRYDLLYNLEEFHGIMMLFGTILVPSGVFFYSGMAERLFSWIKTGK